MVRHIRKRTCKHCKAFFDPAPRNIGRQHYCSQPPCRQASKAASQRRWLRKPQNRDYFSPTLTPARYIKRAPIDKIIGYGVLS